MYVMSNVQINETSYTLDLLNAIEPRTLVNCGHLTIELYYITIKFKLYLSIRRSLSW